MSVKDPFQALVDEITLVRNDVERLQRTSLDRKEAKKLNDVVAQGLDRMAKVGPALQQRIEQSLATAALDLRQQRWSGIFDQFAASLSSGMGFMSGSGFQVLVGGIIGLSGRQQSMR